MRGMQCGLRLRLAAVLVLAAVAVVPAVSQTVPEVRLLETADGGEAVIGVVGSPMGARFELVPRGTGLLGSTANGGPVTLIAPEFTTVAPGRYEVSVTLAGYEPQQAQLSVTAGQAVLVEAVLVPTFGILRTEEAERTLALPYGVYFVEEDEAGEPVGIRPRFPQQELLDFFERAVPISLAATVLFSLLDLARPPERTPAVPVLTLAGQSITLGFAGGGIAMRRRREEFFAAYNPPEIVLRRDAAERLYGEARQAATDGRIAEAVRLAAEFLRLHDASDRVPLVHLQRARIALAEGNAAAAERDLRLIRREYHDLRVYDEAGVLLAEILRGRGEHVAALEVLSDAPVLAGGAYEPAEVSFQRLLSLWELAGGAANVTGRRAEEGAAGTAGRDFARRGIAEAQAWLSDYGRSEAAAVRGAEVRCMLIDLYERAGRIGEAQALWAASQGLPAECAPQAEGGSSSP